MRLNNIQILCTILALLVLINPLSSFGQYTFFSPEGSFAVEISLENPPQDLLRLPIYRNSVSSLIVEGDNIIGGTKAEKGLSPFLFVASIAQRELTSVFDIAKAIDGQRSIETGFFKGKGGFYAGTIPDEAKSGGHLIKVKIGKENKIQVSDLGVPVEGEGIYTLTGNDKRGELYGITYPSGLFFIYDLNTGHTVVYNNIKPTDEDLNIYRSFAATPEYYLTRSLITDDKGRVYGSAPINKLFYFDPSTKSFKKLEDPIPFVWGREVLGRIDSWAKAKDGALYGGNGGDGQLFKVDTETGNINNLGKPIMMNRLKGLVFGADGFLYGLAGGAPGYSHLFKYDPAKGYYDMGNPQFTMRVPGLDKDIEWRGFQLGTVAASPDGKYIVMGEDESLSQLLVFPVKGKNE